MIWDANKIEKLFALPLMDLILQAQNLHRKNFNANEIECCSILSIKTGACPEDCAYCSQSGHYQTNVKKEKVLSLEKVVTAASDAKAKGATRFCLGAAWKSPPARDFPKVLEMITAIKNLGLETCVTLGQINDDQAQALRKSGLDFYNHNLDTSPEYYKKIITTRTYQERIETINCIHKAGINICCGGILGMGETEKDIIELLVQLASLPTPPKSVPINQLMPAIGTPLEHMPPIDEITFIKTIAVTRIILPRSTIRLSAGRINMSVSMQTLCFLAGANSIWLGEKLLTENNPNNCDDEKLFHYLGLNKKIIQHDVSQS